MMIKVAIADDHPMIIDGIQNIIDAHPHMTMTGAYADGTELMQGLKMIVPDVLLLDIQLPGKTGDELTPSILKKYPEIRILTLTNFDSSVYVNNMFRHGVKGYLLKTANKSILIEAIETVYRGEEFLEPGMKQRMEQLDMREKRTFSKLHLTVREKEVLQLIVNGDTNPEIAQKLLLSVHTVENYRDSILLKLDAKNTAALVKKAVMLGLVT